MRLRFLKMHGLGNDFVVIDDRKAKRRHVVTKATARRLCDRHFGVGADQILHLVPAARGSRSDARLEIWNGDGTRAEMCGNGARAVGVYLSRYGARRTKTARTFQIDTDAGPIGLELVGRDQVRVAMGFPRLGRKHGQEGELIAVAGKQFRFHEVSMGNPHAVIFVKDLSRIDLAALGPLIEKHARFPERTNVEFVVVKSKSRIQVKVWERGAGATLACGTGACAAAVAAIDTGRARSPVSVELPGGKLKLEWKAGKAVYKTGPAAEVFWGEIEL
ncbi:MAG: diaminopimelate epimerase [Bacteriovoracia bacterium]